MADYFDNSDPAYRLQPGTIASAEEVDAKFDAVDSGFDQADVDIRRSIKLPATEGNEEISATPLQRRGMLVGFDQDGHLTLTSAFTWRGRWTPNTEYFPNDVVREPVSNNLYLSKVVHTSGTAFNSDRWTEFVNVQAVEVARQAAEDARDAAMAFEQGAQQAQVGAEEARNAAQGYRDDTNGLLVVFQGIYWGAYAGHPAANANGEAPDQGDLYWNTTEQALYVRGATNWIKNDSNALAAQVSEIQTTIDQHTLDIAQRLIKSQNLADVPDKAIARINLELGSAALLGTGSGATDVVQGARRVDSGDGLAGGGTLNVNRTIRLGTPSTVSAGTANAVTTDSHTHYVDATSSRTDPSTAKLLTAAGMNNHRKSGDHDGRYVQLNNGISAIEYDDSTDTLYVRQLSYTTDNPIFQARSGGGSVRFSVAHEAPALVGDSKGWTIAGRGGVVTSDRTIRTGEHLTGGGRLNDDLTLSLQLTANNGIEDGQGYMRAFFGNDGNDWDNISFRSSYAGGGRFNLKRKDGTNTVRFDMWSGKMEIGEVPWARLSEHTSVNGGNGLTGGGSLNSNRTIALGTPSSITDSSTNSVSGSSHTHYLPAWAVRNLISTSSYEQVGSYQLAEWYPTDRAPTTGQVHSGNDVGIQPSPGSYRCMGRASNDGLSGRRIYLWLRVS